MTITHGFELLREHDLAEADSTARLYRHVRTGAELLSLINDDENKAFGIVFRTPPPDSTGVAHILEHSVFCGSRKYPLKKPLIELARGSLATFLNAITSPDRTSYPVASQNLQDFYNLIDVYLDAVFYPVLSRDTFEQEGWHYEVEERDAPFLYNGVVFNEMKGAFSSPDPFSAGFQFVATSSANPVARKTGPPVFATRIPRSGSLSMTATGPLSADFAVLWDGWRPR